MRPFLKTAGVVSAAAAILLAMAAASSARSLNVSEREFTWRWVGVPSGGKMLRFENASGVIECDATLGGHFNERTIAKVARATIGSITRVSIANCEGGSATVLTETLPWRVNYIGFTGFLPRIERIRLSIVGAGISGVLNGITCLLASTRETPIFVEAVLFAEAIASMDFDASSGIPLGGGFLCSFGGLGHVSGSGEAFDLTSIAHVTVTLI